MYSGHVDPDERVRIVEEEPRQHASAARSCRRRSGPRKMNEPIGRRGSRRPARFRRMARRHRRHRLILPDDATSRISSSIRRSFSDSFSSIRAIGIPVIRAITVLIRSASTVAWVSCLISVQFFCSSRSLARSSFSRSRTAAAFSNSCCWIAASFSFATSSTCFSSSRTSVGMAEMREPRARARLVDDVDRLVGQEPVVDVAVGQLDRG